MNNEQIKTNEAEVKVENLFESEVVDTAYTCHENRASGRRW